jgi:AraC-like DNA-binding protein
MMPDQLARQEQIALRLEQSKRMLRDAFDRITAERIGKLISDLDHQQAEEKEK